MTIHRGEFKWETGAKEFAHPFFFFLNQLSWDSWSDKDGHCPAVEFEWKDVEQANALYIVWTKCVSHIGVGVQQLLPTVFKQHLHVKRVSFTLYQSTWLVINIAFTFRFYQSCVNIWPIWECMLTVYNLMHYRLNQLSLPEHGGH